jgi:hypothetical protein
MNPALLARCAQLQARLDNAVVLGPELFRNAGWAGSGSWTVGATWGTPAGGTCAVTAGNGSLSQTVAPSGLYVIGRVYRVAYILVSVSAGNVKFQFTGGTNDDGTVRSANGVYVEDITITQTITSVRFVNGGTNFTGTICAISVREVTRGI